MTLFILGILVFIAALILRRNVEYGRFANVAKGIALLLMVAGILTKCIVQIGAGQIGVVRGKQN